MAFGLRVNFGEIVGNLTKSLRNITSSKIQNLSSMVKKSLINSANNALGVDLQNIIKTSLDLNLSKNIGSLSFSNLLKDIPFPKLSSIDLNSLWGAIDTNIASSTNAFAKTISNVYKKINLNEINLSNKLDATIGSQIDSISEEVNAGIVAGKSSLDVLGNLNKLSNKQIRDFFTNPDSQSDFINNLVEQQKDKIFDLSFNSISEATIFNNQIGNLSKNGINIFSGNNLSIFDSNFLTDNDINSFNILPSNIDNQINQINKIAEKKNFVARKVNLKRYGKENSTLDYLKTLDSII